MSEIDFEEKDHIYRIKRTGEVIPSVTQVLREEGIMGAWGTDYHLQLGRAVHLATALDDMGKTIDPSTLDERVKGRLCAWRRFKADFRPTITEIERVTWNRLYKVAGTIDRILTLKKRGLVTEIKGGARDKAHRLQLAGYSTMPPAIGLDRLAVYIQDDGTYSLDWEEDMGKNDKDVFLSAVAVNAWKRANKIKPKKQD